MAWVKPKHSRRQVDRAGDAARHRASGGETEESDAGYLDVISNWRSAHGYPLQVFHSRIKRTAAKHDKGPIVVHRLKRIESILNKLVRQDSLKLSRMQDIAGCRAVVGSADSVRAVTEALQKAPYLLANMKDYISEPKDDGYRSVHLVYKYEGNGGAADYNDLRIEIQVRSTLQHSWATAVEAVDAFTSQALKANRGTPEWHRFFSLMGTAIALQENCPAVPGTPTNRDQLAVEIRTLEKELNVRRILAAYHATIDYSGRAEGKYYLLRLDLQEGKLAVRRYGVDQAALAAEDYLLTERGATETGEMVVLVSAESLADLKKAYPNYFLDMRRFLRLLATI